MRKSNKTLILQHLLLFLGLTFRSHSLVSSNPSLINNPKGFASEKCVKTADILSLDSIRSTLSRQEETIIFGLIERAQFRSNNIVYEKGGFGNLNFPDTTLPAGDKEPEALSFLEYMLMGTESLHSSVRRYVSPEEHAFFPKLVRDPLPALPEIVWPTDLLSDTGGANLVNFNSIILKRFISDVIPSTTNDGDDEQYGSSVLADITLLQALSRRVHYGKFVAESKYRDNPEEYQRLVNEGDADGVMALLTNAVVEEQVLARSRIKAGTYGRDPMRKTTLPETDSDVDASTFIASTVAKALMAAQEAKLNQCEECKVKPGIIESIYRDIIIPLTKYVEVAYLFKRCGREPPEEYEVDKIVDGEVRMNIKDI